VIPSTGVFLSEIKVTCPDDLKIVVEARVEMGAEGHEVVYHEPLNEKVLYGRSSSKAAVRSQSAENRCRNRTSEATTVEHGEEV
jgi:hypothetical protein